MRHRLMIGYHTSPTTTTSGAGTADSPKSTQIHVQREARQANLRWAENTCDAIKVLFSLISPISGILVSSRGSSANQIKSAIDVPPFEFRIVLYGVVNYLLNLLNGCFVFLPQITFRHFNIMSVCTCIYIKTS